MAYGFSVFWLPLSKAIGITKSVACPADASIFYYLTTTTCDWKVPQLQAWMFGLFFVFLGSAAAIWGGWLERVGPRRAGVVAAFCWAGGFLISAFGIHMHQLWMLWLGSGVIGGIGLGSGLHLAGLDPHQVVSGPARHGDRSCDHGLRRRGDDRRAAGRQADEALRDAPTSIGAVETFVVLGIVYFVFMMGGALGYRLAPEDWKPAGWTPDDREEGPRHPRTGAPERRLAHAAVLAHVARADAQRICGHRHPEPGLAVCCRKYSAAA